MILKKKYLIIVIFILYFTLTFQGSCTIFNEQENKDNKNIQTYLSTSDSVVVEWNCTWGGGPSDLGNDVAADSLNNVYLAGSTSSFGEGFGDMALVKYSSSGVQQWNRTWGGSSGDYGNGVAVDSSENVYLAGYSWSFGVIERDMILVKYNSSGVQQWNRTWGGIDHDLGYRIAVDSFDNVYLAGYTRNYSAGSSDMVLVKHDSSGVQQLNRTWDVSDEDYGIGVAVDSLNNLYLAGTTHNFGLGDYDMVLVKYIPVEKVEEKKEPVIPGYNLFFLLSAISIITVISLKKKIKEKI